MKASFPSAAEGVPAALHLATGEVCSAAWPKAKKSQMGIDL